MNTLKFLQKQNIVYLQKGNLSWKYQTNYVYGVKNIKTSLKYHVGMRDIPQQSALVGKSKLLDFSTMLVFWSSLSLVRTNVALAGCLLFRLLASLPYMSRWAGLSTAGTARSSCPLTAPAGFDIYLTNQKLSLCGLFFSK